jgi:hypothetical protein
MIGARGDGAAARVGTHGRLDVRAQPGWGSSRGWLDAIASTGWVAGGWTRFASVGYDVSAGRSMQHRCKRRSYIRTGLAFGRPGASHVAQCA